MNKNLENVPQIESGFLLGIVFISILVVLFLAIIITGFPSGHFGNDLGTILTCVYLMAWGVTLLFSNFYSSKSFFFRAIIRFFELFSGQGSRLFLIIILVTALFGGFAIILKGFGLLQ